MKQTVKLSRVESVQVLDTAEGVQCFTALGREEVPLRLLPVLTPDQAQALGLALVLAAEQAQAKAARAAESQTFVDAVAGLIRRVA